MSEQPIIPMPVEDPTPVPVEIPVEAAAVLPERDVVAPPGGKVITLPSGFKVALRNPKAVRNKERRYIFEGMNPDDPTESKIALGFALASRIAALLITDWNVRSVDDTLVPFGDVLPVPKVDMAGLDDLPMGDAAILDAEAEEARKILMPDFSPSPDKASPTSPSAG